MSALDGDGAISRLARSDVLTVAFRAVTGLLAMVLAVLGVLAKLTLDDVRDTGKTALSKLDAMHDQIAANRSDITVLTYRVGSVETRVGQVEQEQRGEERLGK